MKKLSIIPMCLFTLLVFTACQNNEPLSPSPPPLTSQSPSPLPPQQQEEIEEPDEAIEDYSLLTEDSFVVRMYYDYEQEDCSFKYVTINKATFSDDVIKAMKEISGISVTGVWYQKDRICIDLDKFYLSQLEEEWQAEYINADIKKIFYTLSSFPKVNRIQILIGGQKDIQRGNVDLEGTFKPIITKMSNDFSGRQFLYSSKEHILKFYKIPTTTDIRNKMEYVNVDLKTIEIYKCEEEIINKCEEICGIKINNFWYDTAYLGMWNEQKKLYVDINSEEIFDLGDDYVKRRQFEQCLFKTFSSFPEVSEIEFLVDGEKGYHDKLYLDSIFVVDNTVDSTIAKFPTGKTFEAKFYESNGYDYENHKEIYTYTQKTVSWESMSDDSVKLIQDLYNVKINGVWYRGKRICVDISEQGLQKFNAGSAAGSSLTYSFIQTFLSYPCVNEVELLVDGVKYRYGDHFTFRVSKRPLSNSP